MKNTAVYMVLRSRSVVGGCDQSTRRTPMGQKSGFNRKQVIADTGNFKSVLNKDFTSFSRYVVSVKYLYF
jgi:hypothetical protein